MSFYCVVQFPKEENAVAIISSKWLTDGDKYCYWPSGPNVNINRLAQLHADVKSTWIAHPCEVKKTTDNFEKAKRACARNEYTSCLDTPAAETETTSFKRRKKRHLSLPPKKNLLPKLVAVAARKRSTSSSSNSNAEAPDENFLFGCPNNNFFHNQVSEVVISNPEVQTSIQTSNQFLQPVNQSNALEFASTASQHLQTTGQCQPYVEPQQNANPLHPQRDSSLNLQNLTANATYKLSDADDQSFQDNAHEFEDHRKFTELPYINSTTFSSPVVQPPPQSSVLPGLQPQSRFEKVVVEYLVQILHNQKELLRRSAENVVPSQAVALPVTKPIASLSDYNRFSIWLKLTANQESLVNYLMVNELSVIGGKSIPDITNRVLETLLSNSFAQNLSLTGRGRKTVAGIKGTEILGLIYNSVRTTKGGETATNSEIDKAIQNWLKGAPDREGGRDHGRHKRKTCQQFGEDGDHLPEPIAETN